jgi:hypothetical protein
MDFEEVHLLVSSRHDEQYLLNPYLFTMTVTLEEDDDEKKILVLLFDREQSNPCFTSHILMNHWQTTSFNASNEIDVFRIFFLSFSRARLFYLLFID